MNLFNTTGMDRAYEQWLEPPNVKAHTDYGCIVCTQSDEDGFVEVGCSNCHEFDIEYALSTECKLCVLIMEEKIRDGFICVQHPTNYCEPGYCDGCNLHE